MSSTGKRTHLPRRSLLAGATGLGVAAALPANTAQAAPLEAAPAGHGHAGRYPANWPEPEPYGLADTRLDLWPREDNSFVLPLELRPRDRERGVVWMRDTYVNCFVVDGRPTYVATGTTRVPGLEAAGPWNDGIFVWLAPSLKGPWRLADTTRVAASDAGLWSEVLTANAAFVAPLVAALAEDLGSTADALRTLATAPTDEPARRVLLDLLQRGNRGRATVPVKRGGAGGDFVTVAVTLADQPGELARVFAVAADARVNVEDVRVEHLPGRPTGLVRLLVRPREQERLTAALTAAGLAASADSH